jgi:hypothetical protein
MKLTRAMPFLAFVRAFLLGLCPQGAYATN